MNIKQIRYNLSQLSKNELEKLILNLYKSNKFNQEYLNSLFNPVNDEELLIKYKKIIKNEFYPDRGEPKLRYSVLRKSLSDFKKICNNKNYIIDLMLSHIENGVSFTQDYGDIDERFYTNIENMFHSALTIITENKLNKEYEDRCLKIKINSEGIGWGFSDSMEEMFYAFYDYL